MTKRKEMESYTHSAPQTDSLQPALVEQKLNKEERKAELFKLASALIDSPDFKKNLEKVREKIKDRTKDLSEILNQAFSNI
jgi:hypothetical protein